MLDAISRLVPAAAKFTRQIVPPVIATLIAAGLISAYNRAFSGHLQQPRMAALHQEAVEPPSEPAAKPLARAEAVPIYDNIAPPPRLWEKEAKQESGKDQAIRLAEPTPVPVRVATPRPEKTEPRTEQRRVAAVEPAPVIRAPAPAPLAATAPAVVAVPPPVVAPPVAAPVVSSMPTVQELRQPVLPPPPPQYQQPQYGQPQYGQPPYQPPPVITAQPVVTVPDRPRPVVEAQAETPSQPQGPIGKFVDAIKPSSLFARAREFGEKIEQAGNDILPTIRQ
jgi:hypothetical protein